MSSHRFPSLSLPPRQSCNPAIASPLHNSFPAYATSVSTPRSPPLHPTPSRASRSAEQKTRERGESRSSSVPTLNVPRLRSGAVSPNPLENRRSVKHLTCFWWKEKGTCRFSEEDCLYAHRDTGHYTDPPRQLIPGEPAKAGRSLDRAMRSLGLDSSHRSSTSLSSCGGSRPVTPTAFATSPTSVDSQATKSDNTFLRNLVEQSTREKAALISTIESLQAEKQSLQSTVDSLKSEREQIQQERDILRGVVGQLQQHRALSSPFGAVGSNRPGFANLPSPVFRTTADESQGLRGDGQDVDRILRNLGPTF